jgi:Protein of unknown function, DUF547
MSVNKKIAIFNVILLLIVSFGSTQAAYRKTLWPKWEINDPLSKQSIKHDTFAQFLNKNLTTNDEGINLVDYPNISNEERELLNHYIWQMSQININKFNRDVQLAFWLNLYNALTIKVVLDHYPVKSIQDINISPGLFSVGPWGANLIRIQNTALSLDDIHNRIIRPIWNDARTHYAINPATIGAANLSKTTFAGNVIDEQLNQVAKNYVNSLRGVQVIDKKLIVSKIYSWYEEDFGGNKQDIINHIKLFADDHLKKKLEQVKTIDGYMYNWHLNTTHKKIKQ